MMGSLYIDTSVLRVYSLLEPESVRFFVFLHFFSPEVRYSIFIGYRWLQNGGEELYAYLHPKSRDYGFFAPRLMT